MNSKLRKDSLDFRSIGTTTNVKFISTLDKLTLSGLNTDTVSLTSLDGLDITANVLKVSTITSSNLYVSGLTIAPSVSTININTTNISVTGLLQATSFSTGTLSISGPSNMNNVTVTNINSTNITTTDLKSTIITNTNLYVSDSEYVNRMYGSSTISDNIGSFNQFQAKMVATGSTGAAKQGYSVAISSIDGTYIAVAGPTDNSSVGANWVFIRSGSTYIQQAVKIIGTGYSGFPEQGSSVCIDPSGLTLVTGGPKNVSAGTTNGALWCFKKTPYVSTQLQPKLIGTGATGAARQGAIVSLSSYDSSYLAVGGQSDNTDIGATWVFIKSGSTYIQQQAKLVGSGATSTSGQGRSVSLDSLGLSLVSGGPGDNGGTGATWLFERSGTTWTQIGTKIIGTGSSGSFTNQGISVSLSSDGLTLAVGGSGDSDGTDFIGATWVFTRASRGITFTQLQSKIIGTGYTGSSLQGQSVSVSSDSNYIAIGANGDNSQVGATWVFIKTGTGPYSYVQFCPKIVGTTSVVGGSYQGYSVSISSSGQYLAVGGYQNDSSIGGTWIFIRSGIGYYESQYLLGSGASGPAYQGSTVSINPDATLLAIGGANDNSGVGATWLFVRSGTTFYQSGTKIVGTGASGSSQGPVSLTDNYLAVGGSYDNSFIGATWTYSISDVWSQQHTVITASGLVSTGNEFGASTSISGDSLTLVAGAPSAQLNLMGSFFVFTRADTSSKFLQLQGPLTGSASVGNPNQGQSVSISKDANYIAIGGPKDNSSRGATWVFKKSGSTYIEDIKLVGVSNIGTSNQGYSVALNADGTYLAVGGWTDNTNVGAVWVFNRTGPTWSQVQKLVGTGNSGQSIQGVSVSINSDGTIITAGGNVDNSNKGAIWVFIRSGTTFYQSTRKLIGTGLSGSSIFGTSISLADNGYLAIGARDDNTNAGATYVYSNAIGMNINNTVVRFTGSPAFKSISCQPSTTCTVGGSTTTLIFTSAVYNITNSYNTSTGLFTAPVSGSYLFESNIYVSSAILFGSTLAIIILESPTSIRLNQFNSTSTTSAAFGGKTIIYLYAGQTAYINLYCSLQDTTYVLNSQQCWFSGTFLG